MAHNGEEQSKEAQERKYFYLSDKKEFGEDYRALEVKYGNYTTGEVTRTYFFEETDNGREWKKVRLYPPSSSVRNLDELAIADRKYLFGIGVDPRIFPALWGKDLGTIVDELVPFLSRNKEEK